MCEDDERPLVSIGMTVYNQEEYVAGAIESILMQQVNFRYEIVISEDCSTDSSREIVIDYAKRYPEVIRLILQEHNVGLYKQSICLKKACRGIYRAQLEGDDYWLTNDKLQKQVDFLQNNPDYIAVSGKIICVNEENIKCSFPYGELTNIYCFEDEYTIEHFQKWLLPSHTGALLYRNIFYMCDSVFLDAYESFDVMGDRKTALLLVSRGRIHILDEVVSARRISFASSSNFTSNLVKVKPYAVICAWMDRLEDMSLTLFNKEISLQNEKRKQWMYSINNFARCPTKTNLSTVIKVYNLSREKRMYINLIIQKFRSKVGAKIKKDGFLKALGGMIGYAWKIMRSLLSSKSILNHSEEAMNVINGQKTKT